MRKRSQKFPDIFPSKVAILDDDWTQVVGSRYAQAVEKKELQSFQYPDELTQYCRGERPIRGTSWMDVEMLLVPLNTPTPIGSQWLLIFAVGTYTYKILIRRQTYRRR